MSEKFCSGCLRWRAERLIVDQYVKPLRGSLVTRYRCVTCAKSRQARDGKKAVAHG